MPETTTSPPPALAGPVADRSAWPELVVYGAAGCCLCDEADPVIDALAERLRLRVRRVAIDGDPELEALWRERIPAGTLDGRLVFKYRPDPAVLGRQAVRAWRERGVEILP